MVRLTLFTISVFLLALSSSVQGQGILIPERHDQHFHLPRPIVRPIPPDRSTYQIKELSINSRVENQIAQTQVSQTFYNTGRRQIEASFVFPLPYDGAIDRMTFMVDGKEYEAKLLPADQARQIYEGYVRQYKDPALLEWIGHGMFKTSVFPIPAGAKRTVTLRYTQLLRKDQAVTDYLVPLSGAKYTAMPIETFSVRVALATQGKLKNVYSPTHNIDVERPDDHHAVVKLHLQNVLPGNDLRVLYTTDDRAIGANVVSYWPDDKEDGYFVMLASPEITTNSEEQPRKSVIFVVDRSGSMNGKKIEQAKDAAKFVLNNLREGDLFNIVAYDSEVEVFKPELQKYSADTGREARGFIEGIFSGGSTNIDGALTTALNMIRDKSLPNYIVFLTDGLPTVGEKNEQRIVQNAKQNNQFGARLISFGVGYDVNSRLLDGLTRENRGQSQYVRPDEDLEEHVSRLYAKIAAPVLTDVKITYDFDSAEGGESTNRLYPAEVFDLFAGQQLVVVGRYRKHGNAKLRIVGKVGEHEAKYDYGVDFAAPSEGSAFSFVAKLWAVRRIGEIIDLIDLQGQNEELVNELVRLSTQHGIITQYTSYLADDRMTVGELTDLSGNIRRSQGQLQLLQEVDGRMGFAQRSSKQMLKSAQNAVELQAQFRGRYGSGGGGIGGGLGRGGQADGPGMADAAGSLEQKLERNMRLTDKDSVYKRGNTLVANNATDVDLEKEKANITVIQRFTAKYFDLLKTTNKAERQLLALQGDSEELIIRLQGKIYQIK